MQSAMLTEPLAALLLPELEVELAKTRVVLDRIPEAEGEFRLHERSRSLASLAGHTADLVSFLGAVLTRERFDFGTEHRSPLVMHSHAELMSAFDTSATDAVAALTKASDAWMLGEFRFLFNGRVVFSGTRYTAYRVNTLNHMIHHRAQLGYYLRALNLPVPATFGPSADEVPNYNPPR